MDKARALWIYETMCKIRAFEEKAYKLFEENKLRGSVHLYTGEEACAATVCSTLTDDDYITSTHRGHGHCIAKGARLDYAIAELMGKATGYCKGRGGSMHIADLEKGNLGANAIVGGGIPIATGAALSIKMQKRQNVAVTFFGDGASNEGTFHEAINFAAVHKLPCIFVCENNGFGISVPLSESTATPDIADRAAGYGIPGYIVDGYDVFDIDKAFMKAKEDALAGKGPSLIEVKTYRYRGHWTGDPEPYRTREEVAEWKSRDAIERFGDEIVKKRWATRKAVEEIKAAAFEEMEKAAQFALDSPEPDAAHLMDDVFYEGD